MTFARWQFTWKPNIRIRQWWYIHFYVEPVEVHQKLTSFGAALSVTTLHSKWSFSPSGRIAEHMYAWSRIARIHQTAVGSPLCLQVQKGLFCNSIKSVSSIKNATHRLSRCHLKSCKYGPENLVSERMITTKYCNTTFSIFCRIQCSREIH